MDAATPGLAGSVTDRYTSFASAIGPLKVCNACAPTLPRGTAASNPTAGIASKNSRRLKLRADKIRNSHRLRLQNSSVPRLHPRAIRCRPHHDQPAQRHQRPTEPNPAHERIERNPNLGRILSAHAGEHDVDILLERSHDADFS